MAIKRTQLNKRNSYDRIPEEHSNRQRQRNNDESDIEYDIKNYDRYEAEDEYSDRWGAPAEYDDSDYDENYETDYGNRYSLHNGYERGRNKKIESQYEDSGYRGNKRRWNRRKNNC